MPKRKEPNKEVEEVEVTVGLPDIKESELDHLRKLYDELRALGINSIGDLENKIARLQ